MIHGQQIWLAYIRAPGYLGEPKQCWFQNNVQHQIWEPVSGTDVCSVQIEVIELSCR